MTTLLFTLHLLHQFSPVHYTPIALLPPKTCDFRRAVSSFRILNQAGYITVQKAFAERKPRTTCQATEAGRKAFLEYMETLQLLFEATKQGGQEGD